MTKLKAIVVACLLGATVMTSCQKESVSPTQTVEENTSSNHSTSARTTNDIIETRSANLQPVVAVVTADIHGYYQALPARYDSTTKNYPLLVYLHGKGELGDGSLAALPRVLKNGTAALLKNGKFPPNFNVNGQNFSFIVIMPQLTKWPTPEDVDGMITFARNKYRVDTSRIYVAGLSMGGGGTWLFGQKYPTHATAIVPIAGANKLNNVGAKLMASENLPVWALHNNYDPTVSSSYSVNNVAMINGGNPLLKPKLTIWDASGHDAWTKASDPNYKENNLNIYEWMLQYKRSSATESTSNAIPSAPTNFNATTSSNTVALSWSAPSTGGTITGYKIYRGTVPGKYNLIKTVTGTTLSCVDGNKVNGTTYYYVIKALNANGESPSSAPINAIPQ